MRLLCYRGDPGDLDVLGAVGVAAAAHFLPLDAAAFLPAQTQAKEGFAIDQSWPDVLLRCYSGPPWSL